MNINKWTIGLAAVGVVSLSSVAQAQEDGAGGAAAAANSVQINGYISSSYRMDGGEDIGANTGYSNESARDSFSLDVIDLQIGTKKSTADWGAGFMVELWLGHQAANLATDTDGGANTEDLAVKQAYIDLNAVGGVELKLGVFDTIIGSEVHNFNNNTFFSRSWGFSIEPTTHTGLLASYKVSDTIGVNLGIANTTDAQINGTATDADNKTVLASVSVQLPDGVWPWAGDDNPASIDVGIVSGKEQASDTDRHSIWAAAGLPLPMGIDLGLSYDLRKNNGGDSSNGTAAQNLQREDDTVLGATLSYDISAGDDNGVGQLTAAIRYEYADIPEYGADNLGRTVWTSGASSSYTGDKIQSITVGLNYQLSESVLTRIEYRHDAGDGLISETQNTADSIIANVIYEF